MKYILQSFLLATALLSHGGLIKAQTSETKKKVTFLGAARAQFYGDNYAYHGGAPDTISNAKLNSGNTLVDLGIHIRPHAHMEIQGMVRVRNDYGGFWGSGVSFDVRQLYLKGVAGGIVRYQLGDINYRLTKYTLWNNNQELNSTIPSIFQMQTDLVNYDHFYGPNGDWRQQGGAAEMGFVFAKWVKELNLKGFVSRVKASDFNQNHDRVLSSFAAEMVQSKYFDLGFTWVNTSDLDGTARATRLFRQPVATLDATVNLPLNKWHLRAELEAGQSKWGYENDSESPQLQGQFGDARFIFSSKKSGWYGQVQTKFVDSEFRSIGAQTKRIQFNALPVSYQRISNSQILRDPTLLDLMRESSLYTTQLQSELMPVSYRYDRITPYGEATPNRQAIQLEVGYQSMDSLLTFAGKFYNGKEVRGEGTLTLRSFQRVDLSSTLQMNRFLKTWKRAILLSLAYRMDQTTRAGTESIPAVDLQNQNLTAGLDIEMKKHWHLLFGWQSVQYKGSDFVEERDAYGSIYNFNLEKLDGKESIWAVGAKHSFSSDAYLIFQYARFTNQQKISNEQNHRMGQWMLLYNISF